LFTSALGLDESVCEMSTITSAYSKAGVDQDLAASAVSALVQALGERKDSFESRQVLPSGHFANVIRITNQLGIAISADGVGTKLQIAEELGDFSTVGIDCIAMNVNDAICVGAEPIAMLDYLAVDTADPVRERQIGEGLRKGAEQAGIEIPGGELAQLGEMVQGFDLAGACFGVVALDAITAGNRIAHGDPVIGIPSKGLHANGYTLARKSLKGLSFENDVEGRLGKTLGATLIEPTEIYVKAVLDLLRSDIDVRGLAHITSEGFDNLLRLDLIRDGAPIGYEIDDPIEVPQIFHLIQERGKVSDEEMREVFNLGCGFCCVVAASDEEKALELLQGHYSGAKRIGCAIDGPRAVRHPAAWPSAA
jgi:phosphoribosylformylglycinamidine cyclo-ligase